MDTIDWGPDWEDSDQNSNNLPYQRYQRSYENTRLQEIKFKVVRVIGFRKLISQWWHRKSRITMDQQHDPSK